MLLNCNFARGGIERVGIARVNRRHVIVRTRVGSAKYDGVQQRELDVAGFFHRLGSMFIDKNRGTNFVLLLQKIVGWIFVSHLKQSPSSLRMTGSKGLVYRNTLFYNPLTSCCFHLMACAGTLEHSAPLTVSTCRAKSASPAKEKWRRCTCHLRCVLVAVILSGPGQATAS